MHLAEPNGRSISAVKPHRYGKGRRKPEDDYDSMKKAYEAMSVQTIIVSKFYN